MPSLKGKQVILRALGSDDAPALRELADNAVISRFVSYVTQPFTLDQARRLIDLAESSARQDRGYTYGIQIAETGLLAGMVGLGEVNRKDRHAALLCWLGQEYQSRGYATEALHLILRFAFVALRLVRVHATVHETNRPSLRLLERLSFVREGILRKSCLVDDRWLDMHSYGLLQEEYRGTGLDRVESA
ncbi:MAG: GNAT family N-acetyltransferase [candidate division Zixibacteria bacterium]|nr:GNAT family N-acetyltransferase [candidate division Zixibacteria bacterium]